MAKTFRDVPLPVDPPDAYALVRNSGYQMPKFTVVYDDPHQLRLGFNRSWGWSNPIDVNVSLWPTGPQQTMVRYEASILALADPFKFMDKNLDRFHQHLLAHHQAWISQTPPPPPPEDTHSAKVNLIIIGVVFGILFIFIAFVVLVAIVG